MTFSAEALFHRGIGRLRVNEKSIEFCRELNGREE
jgi:hypothetical protein